MPIYEYRCQDCNNTFEEIQKITAAPEATCPKCGSKSTHRLISDTSFILKGSGWYATDNPPKSRNATGSNHGSVTQHITESDLKKRQAG